jgi:hypothetical protein
MKEISKEIKLHQLNHSSFLLENGKNFLLADPWNKKPAFGSWLPNPPLPYHPAFIASLSYSPDVNFCILISHGHDDHCDDDYLSLFNKETPIIMHNFKSKGPLKRVEAIGFTNIILTDDKVTDICNFNLTSFIEKEYSMDDAVYCIKGEDYFVVHANDNSIKFSEENINSVIDFKKNIDFDRTVFLSQTNNASCFPLAYPQFNENVESFLKDKVIKTISVAGENIIRCGIKNFISYAGFASAFVKDNESLLTKAVFPTPEKILNWLPDLFTFEVTSQGEEKIQLLNMLPGDVFNFRDVEKAFWNEHVDPDVIKQQTINYYKRFREIETCASYRKISKKNSKINIRLELQQYLTGANKFIVGHIEKTGFGKTALGKKLRIDVGDVSEVVEIGFGLTSDALNYNKRIDITKAVFERLINKDMMFEDLYVGGAVKFYRQPKEVFNHDLIRYMQMYGYVYRRGESYFSKYIDV